MKISVCPWHMGNQNFDYNVDEGSTLGAIMQSQQAKADGLFPPDSVLRIRDATGNVRPGTNTTTLQDGDTILVSANSMAGSIVVAA